MESRNRLPKKPPRPERPGLAALAAMFGTRLWQQGEAEPILHLEVDSRRILTGENTLFIALSSSRREGMDFLPQAYEKGVRNFLVPRPPLPKDCPGANVWVCEDPLSTLQKLVSQWRKRFTIPVVGITGSNGKTVVKEWLFQLLGDRQRLFRSPKSYNSQIGVPLSVWMMGPEHDMALIEAGISQTGEMDRLEKIIAPTMGIFTNISEAHSEGFMNNRQKINEKLQLFKQARQLVYCKDYAELNEQIVQFVHNLGRPADEALQLFTWSHKTEANLRITAVNPHLGGMRIEGVYQDRELAIEIPFSDSASVENAIHCWAFLLMIGEKPQEVARSMARLSAVSMRLELRKGIQDSTLINDSYNSDLTSLRIALDLLIQQTQHDRFTLIMSDMLQIARSDRELYEEVAQLVTQRGIHRFIGIGPALMRHRDLFRNQEALETEFFESTEAFLKQVHLVRFEKEGILIKGARNFEFEKIQAVLEQKIHQTVLSVNLSALEHNLKVFQSRLSPETRIMAMVKAFSYGSGSYEIAHSLEKAGVHYLAVAYTEEGIALRRGGLRLPIMVMSADGLSYDRMIAWNLEPELYSLSSLDQFLAMARNLNVKDFPVHIKLDTGMHRLGFVAEDLPELLQKLKAGPELRVASLFSHLAASEDPGQDEFTEQQARLFDQLSQELIAGLGYRPLCHLANSAAIGRHRKLHYDMVRIGLGLYGIGPSPHPRKGLLPIATLRTTIAQIKSLKKGETVGYGRKGKLERDSRIGVISIGYADGFPRSLGRGNGQVWIRGRAVPTVGEVCMDMCMVDLTDLGELREGEEVILFGPDNPLTSLAEKAGLIPYELMTGISPRVKRVYLTE